MWKIHKFTITSDLALIEVIAYEKQEGTPEMALLDLFEEKQTFMSRSQCERLIRKQFIFNIPSKNRNVSNAFTLKTNKFGKLSLQVN